MTERHQKISFGEMRDMGVRGVVVYCRDFFGGDFRDSLFAR
jgi:hypothetical protein